jgi:outer membrane protein OmpA-like peptidoglycan-associated protein
MFMFMKRTKWVLSFIVFVATAAAVTPAVAGASGVSLLTDTFTNSTLANPASWSLPAGSSGVCLTAGTNTSTTPVPDCQSSGGDANGSGALRLTDNAGDQVGTIFSNITLPTADGLDVTWDSYQYNGTGADGISFDFAAANPANPQPPTTTGPNGGSLGYTTDGGVNGMPDGYLGFGADVYGNFENTSFGGSGCTQTSPATKESMGVRGPGNGTAGYCLLGQVNLASPLTLDSQSATSRTGLAVPEEVVLNSTGSAVTASASGVSVPAGDYLFATEPLSSGHAGSTWKSTIGALPTDPVGVPAAWLGTNGIPQALAFGWAASTGGSNEFHDINNLQATSLLTGPTLSLTNADSGGGVLYTNTSDTVTLAPGVSASSTVNETDTVTVTDTFPAGLTPSSASGTGWTCTVAGQNVSCTLPAGDVAPGASFAAITVDVTTSATPGPFANTASASSTDGAPATATDSGIIEAPLAQVINFTNTPPSPLYVNGTYVVAATGGGSGNPVTLTVDGSSTSGCTIDVVTGVVTLSHPAGTCVIDANQAGDAAYSATTQVQQSVSDTTTPQVISFTDTPPSPLYVNGTYEVTTDGGGSSGNPVTLTVDGTSTSGCTINVATGVVTLSAPAGTCVIDANQAGDSAYSAAAQVQQSVADLVSAQVINFTNTPPSTLYVNGTYVVTAIGGASGNPVVFSVDGTSTSDCTIDTATGVVSLSAPAGTCVIDANQPGNAAYSAATQVQQSVSDTTTPQVIDFTNTPPSPLYVSGTYLVTGTGGGSGNPIVFSVDGSSTSGCTIDAASGVVTLSAPAGSCVIDANQPGNAAYSAAAQVQQSVLSDSVSAQVISFTDTPPTHPSIGSSYVVTATGGGSGNPVVFSVDGSSTSGCTIVAASGVVTLSAPVGTCVIDANQAGDAAYSAAVQAQQSVLSNSVLAQMINFTDTPPTHPSIGSTYVVTATGGSSGNPVVFSVDVSSTSGCTIDATTGVVTLSAPAGTCVIDANQTGDAAYSAAAQVRQSVSDTTTPQVISFTDTPPTHPSIGSTYVVTATGGGSGNPVVFSVEGSSTSGCTIVAATGVVTLSAPVGTCVIDANQAGDAAYSAAAQVQQSVASITATISLVLHYANNSWFLTAWSCKHLHSLALAIKKDRLTLVELKGFASSTGTVGRNNVLGIERARVPAMLLKTYLRALHVRHVTLRMMGYGASQFVAKPTSAAANRRTEITVS